MLALPSWNFQWITLQTSWNPLYIEIKMLATFSDPWKSMGCRNVKMQRFHFAKTSKHPYEIIWARKIFPHQWRTKMLRHQDCEMDWISRGQSFKLGTKCKSYKVTKWQAEKIAKCTYVQVSRRQFDIPSVKLNRGESLPDLANHLHNWKNCASKNRARCPRAS